MDSKGLGEARVHAQGKLWPCLPLNITFLAGYNRVRRQNRATVRRALCAQEHAWPIYSSAA